jgi:hypothetical protein
LLPLAAVAFALTALLAVACQQVGYGDLHVANDLSGAGRDNTWIRAFVAEPGDVFPPSGYLSLWVRGDDFGRPLTYGMNGYVYLVRGDVACPQTEAGPELLNLSDVTIVGIVTVKSGSVDQFVLMEDTPANRDGTWALIDINEWPGSAGDYFVFRCGGVTWTP